MSQFVALRLDDKYFEQLQGLVESGEFGNISEAIRYCIRMQLKGFQSRSPPPLMMAEARRPAVRRRRVSCHKYLRFGRGPKAPGDETIMSRTVSFSASFSWILFSWPLESPPLTSQ